MKSHSKGCREPVQDDDNPLGQTNHRMKDFEQGIRSCSNTQYVRTVDRATVFTLTETHNPFE